MDDSRTRDDAPRKPSSFRQWAALLNKNFRLRRRHPASLCCEIFLPVLFLLLMAALDGSPKTVDAIIPGETFNVPPLSFFVNQSASYPNILCYDNNLFTRCDCDYTKPATALIDDSISNYHSEGLKYPIEGLFQSAHAETSYQSLCSAYGIAASSAPTSSQCAALQTAVDFCPRYIDLFDTSSFDCPDLSLVPVEDSDELANMIANAVNYAVSIDAGISIPEDDIGQICAPLAIGVAPFDDSGSDENKLAVALYAYLAETAPGIEDYLMKFESIDAVQSYVGQSDYSRSPDIESITAAIIITAGAPSYAYTLRANYTRDFAKNDNSYRERNVPPTAWKVAAFLRTPWDTTDEDGAIILPFVQSYFQSGVLSLQQAVDQFIFDLEGAPLPAYRVANMASPEYRDSNFWASAGAFFSIVMVLVFMYPVANVIKQLVVEKELKIKEGMLQMGLSSSAYQWSWIAWFVIIFFVIAILLTIIGSNSIFKNSDPGIVFLWFFFFFLATIALCFLLSTFFSKARSAATYGTLIFFLTVFPFFALTTNSSTGALIGACIIPTTCFAVGTFPFADYEDSGQGVTGNTIASTDTVNISMAQVLFMLVVDIVFYSFLAWYAGQVVPSEWGTQRPWYFPFTANYWCPGRVAAASADRIAALYAEDETARGGPHIQPVDDSVRKQLRDQSCVAIRGLGKRYKSMTGDDVQAVKDLTLTMYRGQITALLGHNGAGKTTTMNMLSGMIPVTSGAALVQGRDVARQMKAIRRDLGVCPQHDILYQELTVKEHLQLFATIKGVPRKQKNSEVERMIRAVGLTEKRDERTKSLSGGQKRKLSVAIAFIGGSKIVFLDEPTSGMDPHSRRFTWNVIRQQKEGRVIVLTTHFMDEADLLGDRVAIMSHGELKCVGSSLFLKSHFGAGYNLTVVKKVLDGSGATRRGADAQERQAVKDLVKSYIKSAVLLSDVGAEVAFQLPGVASSKFKPMLVELDRRSEELGVSSYGMSITTLEEVFLRVAAGTADIDERARVTSMRLERERSTSGVGGAETAIAAAAAANGTGNGDGHEGNGNGVEGPGELKKQLSSKPIDSEEFTGATRFWRHVRALVVKRVLTFKRDKKLIGFTVFAPSFFLLVGLIVLLALGGTNNQPSKLMTPDVYNDGLDPQNPMFYPSVCVNSTGSGTCDPAAFVDAVPSDGILGKEVTSGVSSDSAVADLNSILIDTREDYEASRYSALVFETADSDTGSVDVINIANYTGVHAAPIFLNQIANSALSIFAGSGDTAATIELTMFPLPFTNFETSINDDVKTFPTVLFLLIGTAFVPAAWAGFLVRERETKSKHQQVVSGVSLNAYWISTYIWDIVSFLPTPTLACIFLAAFKITALTNDGGASALALLLYLWGPAIMGLTYITSFGFTQYASAMTNTLFLNWLTGLIGSIAIFFMTLFSSTVKIAKALKWVLRFMPSFALGDGLLNLGNRNLLSYLYGSSTPLKPWDLNIAGADVYYLAGCSVAYFFVVLYMERAFAGTSTLGTYFTNKRLRRRFAGAGSDTTLWNSDLVTGGGIVVEDVDVVNERHRVEGVKPTGPVAADVEGQAALDVVLMQGMRKVYPAAHKSLKVALRDMWLGIPKGECFGLLGINGAGKSTTISILCGEQTPTQGGAYLSGKDIIKYPEAIHKLVGYCPQFDALFDTLTGREHLTMYARIKGVPEDRVKAAVDQQIVEMNLSEYADKLAGGYSGGNKRKLSVAVAMLGNPEIVFLDEPSTGVDPVARRFMWSVINRIVTQNRECALVLTTHSMEEAEALCQRIGVMVGGRLRCLGSAQHLKSRFGQGFQLECTVALPRPEDVAAARQRLLTGAGVAAGTEKLTGMEQVAAALSAYPELAPEFRVDGQGTLLYQELLARGSLHVADLSSWCVLEERCRGVEGFVATSFAGAALKEKQGTRMRFDLPPQRGVSLGEIFGLLEENRERLFISEYALGQTSLEQIFNFFAAQQMEESEAAPGMTGLVHPALGAASVATAVAAGNGEQLGVSPAKPEEEKEG